MQAFQLEFDCKTRGSRNGSHTLIQFLRTNWTQPHWIELWRNLSVDCAGGTLISPMNLKRERSKLQYVERITEPDHSGCLEGIASGLSGSIGKIVVRDVVGHELPGGVDVLFYSDGTQKFCCNVRGPVQADGWIVRGEKNWATSGSFHSLHCGTSFQAAFVPTTVAGCWVVHVVEGGRAVSRMAERKLWWCSLTRRRHSTMWNIEQFSRRWDYRACSVIVKTQWSSATGELVEKSTGGIEWRRMVTTNGTFDLEFELERWRDVKKVRHILFWRFRCSLGGISRAIHAKKKAMPNELHTPALDGQEKAVVKRAGCITVELGVRRATFGVDWWCFASSRFECRRVVAVVERRRMEFEWWMASNVDGWRRMASDGTPICTTFKKSFASTRKNLSLYRTQKPPLLYSCMVGWLVGCWVGWLVGWLCFLLNNLDALDPFCPGHTIAWTSLPWTARFFFLQISRSFVELRWSLRVFIIENVSLDIKWNPRPLPILRIRFSSSRIFSRSQFEFFRVFGVQSHAMVQSSITHNEAVHVHVLWLFCTHTISFRMLLCPWWFRMTCYIYEK